MFSIYCAYCCRFAYIRQEDLFFSQLTVKETLSLAAELQLQDISSVEEREEYVNNLLFKLGLVMLPSLSYLIFIVSLVKPRRQSNSCFL